MKAFFQITILVLFSTGYGFSDEWVLPWVSNRDGEWKSVMTLNNHSSQPASVDLTAIRGDGSSERVTGLSIPAFSQKTVNPGETFTNLGSGSGYSVFIHSETSELSCVVKVSALSTESGDSPSMAGAVHFSQSFTQIVLPTLPYDGGIAAAVLLNLSPESSTVTIQPRGSQNIYEPREVILPSGRPQVFLIFGEGGLVEEADESIALEISGDAALTGTVFSFNSLNEPSLINAVASPAFDTNALTSILGTLDTTATVADTYVDATSKVIGNGKKDNCPTVSGSIDFDESSSYVVVDWGSGCTNPLGVYHEGQLSFSMDREGISYISGQAALINFGIRYQADIYKIDGSISIAGSTIDKYFSMTGNWEASANNPGFYATYRGDIALNINGLSTGFSAYGRLSSLVTGDYSYSLEGSIPSSDPILYDLNSCVWPTEGSIYLQATSGSWPKTVSIDFGTGNCATALLTINGVAQTINLNDYL